MAIQMKSGMVRVESSYSGPETVQRVHAALREKGLTIFAVIDHSGEAQKVGMKMPFTQLIIFGSPKAGTPLMIATPSLAIDLPLKALVVENDDGTASLFYNSADYLQQRHDIDPQLLPNIAGAGPLLQKAVE